MRTESSLVAQILQQRPQRETTSHKAEKPTVMEQNIAKLFGEVQVATKIINEIFVEGSIHIQEFARLKSSTTTTPAEEQQFFNNFSQWFSKEIHSAINQMPGATQSVGCYVLKDRLERFPIFDPQWTPPFVRNGTVLEKFLASNSPVLLGQLKDVNTLLTHHKTNASEAERNTVIQWQAALNELTANITPHKTFKI